MEKLMAAQQYDTVCASTPIRSVLALLNQIDKLQLAPRAQRDVEQRLAQEASIMMEQFIPHNPGHGRRAATYCALLGQALALSDEEIHDLRLAGLLHDIGLLCLDEKLLASPDAWDAAAYAHVQSHPRIGAELLRPFAFLSSAALAIAHHHERWDGSGYPYGLRGNFIPLPARILAIADAYDSIHVPVNVELTARQQVCLRILKVGAGTQFDPTLVSIFASALQAARSRDHADSGNGSLICGGDHLTRG
jgi:HD-GYP domain-containing protein (c-di-GMP phosphodiesterase class II)